ncbi:MAG TPA: tyrosine-type recombinase/integrase [Candidatus Dormibacteraeota bacterium]
MPTRTRPAPSTSQMTPVARLVEDYLNDCRARGLSAKTIRTSYHYALNRVLVPFCEREGIGSLKDLDQRALNRLSTELLERGPSGRPLSRFSVASYLNAINLFLGWAGREGELDSKVRAQTPRLPRRILEVLSREEIERLEDAAKTERDKLMVRVLADSGLRASELLGLCVRDLIQRDRQYLLKVEGKGAQERLVPVPPATYRRLQRLVRGRGPDEHVFLTLKRRDRVDYAPLSIAGLQLALWSLGKEARIEKRVYPHLLRHSFATWALSRGMNPIQLAQILGHSSLRMIQQVYSHLTPGDAYDALMSLLVDQR